eukprot:m.143996 g.143996  ORF g.143996 m.143996 type:complete len:62 (+) comp38398_c1_seq3:969-1154(+)
MQAETQKIFKSLSCSPSLFLFRNQLPVLEVVLQGFQEFQDTMAFQEGTKEKDKKKVNEAKE